MRLLRPGPRTGAIASSGPPSSSAATSAAATAGSAGSIEHRRCDRMPIAADRVGVRAVMRRKEDAPDAARKARIGEHLLEIVDEMTAVERRDASKLFAAVIGEKNAVALHQRRAGHEKPLLFKPRE